MSERGTLTAEYIAARWPRLFHMAEAGSWPSIERFGLLSTTALLDLYDINGAERDSIESARRATSVSIKHPEYGEAWIRDNKPINETVLRRTLVGMTVREWYQTLNRRVFFWLSEQRLDRMRRAPPYRSRQHDILVIDTGRLLEAHAENVELSPLNSGAVHPAANYPRGSDTFQPIAAYPFLERCRIRPAEPIVELTVHYEVQDVAALVVDVFNG